MLVDDALISKLEMLSRLKLDHDERENLKIDLASMINMFSKIGEVPTEGVEPLVHLIKTEKPYREDIVVAHPDNDSLLSEAPELSGRFFNVPKVIE
jgi:aspartyl-tRNA(Asn)/glutamyl-tRNA(Gln) amidotransferase subunit C